MFNDPAFSIRFRNAFILFVCLLLAVMIGSAIGTADYRTLLLVIVIGAGAAFWFRAGPYYWPITVASSALAGTFPILGGSFTPFQLLMAGGVAKFLVEDVIMRRAARLRVPRIDLILLTGFMGVIFLHALHDRFGMKFLGSDIWGGRNYINVFVGLAAYFVIQSIQVKGRVWDRLPYIVLAVSSFDLMINLVTAIWPSSIYIIYPFYSAVAVSGVAELVQDVDTVSRIGAFGGFGLVIVTIVLARAPIYRLLHLGQLRRLILVGLGSLGVLASGFRSAVANLAFLVMAAAFRDLRLKALTLIPLLAVGLFTLSFVNSKIVKLPRQAQRALAFMPGEWDADMQNDAASSNEFRANVWTFFLDEYFPKHPWLGRGFGFRSEWVQSSVDVGASSDYQQWVEVGNIHNGFLASLDALGILGSIFFILWNVRLLWKAFQISFAVGGEGSFATRFVALGLAVAVLSYWLGAVTVGTYLPQVFASAGVFFALQRKLHRPPASETLPDPRRSSIEGPQPPALANR